MSSRELRASLTLTADGGNFTALIKSAKKALDDFGSSAGQTEKASRRLDTANERTALSTMKAGNAFLRAHGQHIKFLRGFANYSVVTSAIRSTTSAIVEYESLRTTLEAVTGSASLAAGEFAQMQEIVDRISSSECIAKLKKVCECLGRAKEDAMAMQAAEEDSAPKEKDYAKILSDSRDAVKRLFQNGEFALEMKGLKDAREERILKEGILAGLDKKEEEELANPDPSLAIPDPSPANLDPSSEEERKKAREEERENALKEVKEAARQEKNIVLDLNKAKLDIAADTFKAFSSQSSKAFKAYKAFQIASALVDSYKSASAAYNAMIGIPIVGPALAVGAATAALTFGFQQAAAIRAQEPPQSAFRQGGIVEGAQFFGFNRERHIGLAGEAGPEAIIPLRRTSSGDLGVQAIGAGDGRGGMVTINAAPVVQVTVGEGSDGQVIGEQAGAQIVAMIDAYVIEEQRPGGRLNSR